MSNQLNTTTATTAIAASDATRDHTGVVIPVYFPPGSDRSLGESLLRTGAINEALVAFRRCLQVNPDGNSREYIESVFAQYGTPDIDLKEGN